MTEKTKKIALITVCCLLCAAAVIGIAYRFGGNAEIPSGSLSDTQPEGNEPTVDIDAKPNVRPGLSTQTPEPDKTDPGQGADSTGTEQTIQADPVKPEAPEKPAAPSGPATSLPDGHKAEDVPQEERRTEDEEHPVYEEQPTVTPAPQPNTQGGYDQGGAYVPGFGYIPSSGAGTVTQDSSIYENGNKVGVMD